MLFRNSLFTFKKRISGERPGKSNLKDIAFDDKIETQLRDLNTIPAAENVGNLNRMASISRSECVLTRNMNERDVRVEIFMFEGEDNFDTLSLRAKMTQLVKRSNSEVKEWFYEMGIEEKLPESWNEFKIKIIDFCCGQGIDNIRKYKEELWSQYLERLRCCAKDKNISEEDVLKKLRRDKAPKTLQMIFYSFNVSLKDIYLRILEWERYNYSINLPRENTYSNDNFNDKNKHLKGRLNDHKKRIKCFKCNELGHYSNECNKKDDKINILRGDFKRGCKLDIDKIKIQGKDFMAIFDTGACESVITSKILKKISRENIFKRENEFTLINGDTVKINRGIKLDIIYKGKNIKEIFNIVENDKNEEILLSNNLVKKLRTEVKIPIECTIDTRNNIPISWSRPIRSFKDKKDFHKLVCELENKGIVSESNSRWLNPVHLVRKKNGDLRFCIDFRKLNDLVEQDNFEIPRIKELISTLYGKKYFTRIDLKDGFFQIPIKKTDREKTAFYTGSRLMEFNRMPQGYKNSPAIFQRAMHLIVKNLIGNCCIVYIDDILVFGESIDEHDRNLSKIIERLNEFGLEENKDKREERVEKIKFLGYQISLNHITPSFERAQGIVDYKAPKTKRELQRFLGMINYDRMFISNLSSDLKILYALTEKKKKFEWGEDENNIFENIKSRWKDNLSVIIPNPDKSYELETDASNTGIGAVLRQEGKPVAYISRLLNKAEQNYGITEKETLAALWAMEKLEYFLMGSRFSLITDHKAIEQLKSKVDFGSQRIQRWFQRF
ncbi:Retrovirus-related Pol polyprotein from transposon 17.6 [Dictyocoela muelleri]|nr:Retrovirus-related Pol polyprotein from transposon 17.6 [Dictyocoela muelleri]